MRLLVTRPEPDAEKTADILRRLGHEPLVAPMLTVVPREEQSIALRGVQAICFTSRNAVRIFAERSSERAIPVYAVGPGTMAEARTAGFRAVREDGGDGRSLVEAVRRRLAPTEGAVLHARGAAVAYDVAESLRNLGFSVREQVLYETLPALALPPETRRAWVEGTLEGVLLFSPRSAKTFATLLKDAGLSDGARTVTAYCLSEAVRDAADLPWKAVRVAAQPDVPAIIKLLEGDEGTMAEERKTEGLAAPGEPTGEGQGQGQAAGGEQNSGERDSVEAIIAKFGGLRPMASKLDLAVSTVQGWKIRGHIPEQRHEEILKAAKEHGIEVTAAELSADRAQDASAPEAPAAETESRAEATAPEEGRPPTQTKSPLPASGSRPTASAAPQGAAAAKTEAKPEEKAAPASAPAKQAPSPAPQAAPPQRGGFGRGMLFGALLCIGGAVAAVALRDSWMPLVGAPGPGGVDPTALEQRLEALSGDLAATREEIAALGERAAGLEADLEVLSETQGTDDASEELQAVRDALGAVQEGQGEAQAALAAQIESQVAALSAATEAGEGALREEIAALAAQAEALATEAAESRGALETLSSEIAGLGIEDLQGATTAHAAALAALGTRLDTVEEQVGRQQSAERSALLLALGRLSDAAGSGEAYAQPLMVVRDIAGDRLPAEAVATLEGRAAEGALPPGALQERFADTAAAIVAAAYDAPAGEGVIGDVMRNLTQLVIVRSRSPDSPGVDGVVARAEAAMAAGDLSGAVAELSGLEGPPAEAAAPWLADARARLAVDGALAEVTAALDAQPPSAAN